MSGAQRAPGKGRPRRNEGAVLSEKFVTLKLEDPFSPGTTFKLVGRVLEFYSRGFVTEGGGWSLMSGDRPAEFVKFKEKGHQRIKGIRKDSIVNFEEIFPPGADPGNLQP